MNEKLAKKLGEVLAFARAGIDTYKKGETALKEKLGNEYSLFLEENEKFIKNINLIADSHEVGEIVTQKSEKTFEKLNKMRDMYIGDSWDDAIEIFEWSGFFHGAGMVHWGLVESAARKNNIEELVEPAEMGTEFFHKQLMNTMSELKMAGKEI